MAGVRSISSNSRFGRSRVTVEFAESVDIDVAATDIRDAVARVEGQLPTGADAPQVVKADADAQIGGAGRGLSFAITGDSYERLADLAETLVERMQDDPAFGEVQLEYEITQPQLFVEIDRTRAADLGIDITGLGDALRAMLNGRTVGSVFIGDQSHDIQMLSSANPVNDPGDLQNVYVRTGDGQMVPMSSFVHLEERPVTPELDRENQGRAVRITAGLTPELALGVALARVEALGGWVIVGGLGLATLSTLYLRPVVYLLLARFSKPRAEESKRLARELEEVLAG
nr:efflux RND transporter permease subunit [Rhodovulum sp.]